MEENHGIQLSIELVCVLCEGSHGANYICQMSAEDIDEQYEFDYR